MEILTLRNGDFWKVTAPFPILNAVFFVSLGFTQVDTCFSSLFYHRAPAVAGPMAGRRPVLDHSEDSYFRAQTVLAHSEDTPASLVEIE